MAIKFLNDLSILGCDANWGDSDKAIFGVDADMQLYHDGTDNHIVGEQAIHIGHASNGGLKVAGGNVQQIGQSTHTTGKYLKWDGTNAVWDSVTATINISGYNDIGAALVDADLLLVDDGAGGTTRKATMARLSTYINGKVPDASDSDKGLIKVSATDASVVPENISTTANRSYQVQTTESGVASVNVPWTDTTTDSTKLPLAGGTITGTTSLNSDIALRFGTSSTFIEGATSGSKLMLNGQTDMFMRINGTTILQLDPNKAELAKPLDITDTTDSTDATGDTGALRCEGGGSIAKKLYVGSTITGSADVVAYSDKRLKQNVKTLDSKKVLEMRGVSFDRVDTGKASSGVIAQEIEKIAPELVIDDGNFKGVAYGNLVGYLIEAIKDQQKQIDELKELCNGCSR